MCRLHAANLEEFDWDGPGWRNAFLALDMLFELDFKAFKKVDFLPIDALVFIPFFILITALTQKKAIAGLGAKKVIKGLFFGAHIIFDTCMYCFLFILRKPGYCDLNGYFRGSGRACLPYGG